MSVLIENMEMPKDCLHCCFKNIGTGYELTLCDLAGWVKTKDGCRADECPLAETQPESQWIPVAERLPEGGGYYIVTENISEDGDKWVGLRWYSTVHGWEFNPVAWMPFPKPYQEEGERE